MIARAWLAGIVVAIAAAAAPLHAQELSHTVALLPLDTDKSLKLYGQPVASELARALVAGDVDVVIVGAKMAVPEKARLVVDGTVKEGGPRAPAMVVLSLRVRNPADGRVLDQLSATAPTLANIDQAAADLAARVLPVLRARLEALDAAAAAGTGGAHDPPLTVGTPPPLPDPHSTPLPPPALAPIAIAVSSVPTAITLRDALGPAVQTWTRTQQHEPSLVAPAALAGQAGMPHVALVVLDYEVEREHGIALARARVRVTLGGDGTKPFDRIVVTDTIVGVRGEAPPALAARVAAEVLAILRPHVHRLITGWP